STAWPQTDSTRLTSCVRLTRFMPIDRPPVGHVPAAPFLAGSVAPGVGGAVPLSAYLALPAAREAQARLRVRKQPRHLRGQPDGEPSPVLGLRLGALLRGPLHIRSGWAPREEVDREHAHGALC